MTLHARVRKRLGALDLEPEGPAPEGIFMSAEDLPEGIAVLIM